MFWKKGTSMFSRRVLNLGPTRGLIEMWFVHSVEIGLGGEPDVTFMTNVMDILHGRQLTQEQFEVQLKSIPFPEIIFKNIPNKPEFIDATELVKDAIVRLYGKYLSTKTIE